MLIKLFKIEKHLSQHFSSRNWFVEIFVVFVLNDEPQRISAFGFAVDIAVALKRVLYFCFEIATNALVVNVLNLPLVGGILYLLVEPALTHSYLTFNGLAVSLELCLLLFLGC